ncbi:uncharacterized protein LOC141900661 [Tubulanus polymorphus]|uniref:uncharacterized protein LOC141900661 n=1 Tax=Tubulanus polymorphus TaxID=672921 RepID=UPI003DA49ACE
MKRYLLILLVTILESFDSTIQFATSDYENCRNVQLDLVKPMNRFMNHTYVSNGSDIEIECSKRLCIGPTSQIYLTHQSTGRILLTERTSDCTIKYSKSNVRISDSGIYGCFINNTAACDLHLRVGYAPVNLIGQIRCQSPNWEWLECEWGDQKNIESNKITDLNTTWSVTPRCSRRDDLKCLWTRKDYHPDIINTVSIEGFSLLGRYKKTIKVKPKDVVVPAGVENLTVISSTNTTVSLSWSLSRCENLSYDIPRIRSSIYRFVLKFMFYVDSKRHSQWINGAKCGRYKHTINNLYEPYRNYTVSIVTSVNGSLLRSKPSETITAQTTEGVPISNPRTTDSGFQQTICGSDCRHILLYYQYLNKRQARGIVVKVMACYRVMSSDDVNMNPLNCVRCEVMLSYCRVRNLTLTLPYEFYITAATSAGSGPVIPTSEFRLAEYEYGALAPYNVVAERTGATTVTVYWTPAAAATEDQISKRFVVFENCKGFIDWKIVDSEIQRSYTIYNIRDISKCQFAVSAENYAKLSGSGLSDWTTCIYTAGNGVQHAPKFHIIQQYNQLNISLLLTWPRLTCNPAFERPLQLNIYWRGNDRSEVMNQTLKLNSNNFTIADVNNSTVYNIRLQVVGLTSSKFTPWISIKPEFKSYVVHSGKSVIIPIVIAVATVAMVFIIFIVTVGIIRKWKSTPGVRPDVPQFDDDFISENSPCDDLDVSETEKSQHKPNGLKVELKPLMNKASMSSAGNYSTSGLGDSTSSTSPFLPTTINYNYNNNSSKSVPNDPSPPRIPRLCINSIPLTIDNFAEEQTVELSDSRPLSCITNDTIASTDDGLTTTDSSMTDVSSTSFSDAHCDLVQEVLEGYRARMGDSISNC